MAENTAISWAHDTFNPWEGCTRISPACDHCYAAQRAARFGNGHLWAGQLRRTSPANWRKPLRWNAEAAYWDGPRRVFCASLADVFDNQAPQAWRDDLWALIEATPLLTWLLLTKRPQKIVGMVPPAWLINPPDNVWYGATIENRATMMQRAVHLADVPAVNRFWSCEPLLEDLGDVRHELGHLGVVIAGGESGPKARPSHPDWFRSLRDQCAETRTIFHFKQWGEWRQDGSHVPIAVRKHRTHIACLDRDTGRRKPHPNRFSDETMILLGKAAAGRLLDGELHDRMPGERHPDDCCMYGAGLSETSAAAAKHRFCDSCNEEIPF